MELASTDNLFSFLCSVQCISMHEKDGEKNLWQMLSSILQKQQPACMTNSRIHTPILEKLKLLLDQSSCFMNIIFSLNTNYI